MSLFDEDGLVYGLTKVVLPGVGGGESDNPLVEKAVAVGLLAVAGVFVAKTAYDLYSKHIGSDSKDKPKV